VRREPAARSAAPRGSRSVAQEHTLGHRIDEAEDSRFAAGRRQARAALDRKACSPREEGDRAVEVEDGELGVVETLDHCDVHAAVCGAGL